MRKPTTNPYILDEQAQAHLKTAQAKLGKAAGLLEMVALTDFKQFDDTTISTSLSVIVTMLYEGLNDLGEV
ncbi:hypothetical protein E4T80_03160 [Muribacter muris]|uniref:Uncharacterized protein n=1 Tax=Muribacter muris TaxID=67855 RepID=A0A4Y9K2L0_9PAST|nr:hypothetical protein [Muribacter muris]MBF0784474.1 hypothetical protein [Muribacter muris]MBF0826230.1 hypothetical protein [Muribacter muris]TFV11988.1 hypothetical protein E4T80_03160 [Muribacter muris]